jgi:ribosome-associated protein
VSEGPPRRDRPPDAEVGDALVVSPALVIPRAELDVRATRAGGPGGQHVNTSSTRIELRWSVRDSRAPSDAQRALLLEKLASRLDGEGAVRVVASEYRSQRQNRDAAEARLARLVREALVVPKVRRPTKPTRGSVARRLDEKRRLSAKKADRRRSDD